MDNKGSKIILHISAYFYPFIGPLLFYFLNPDEEVKRLSVQAILFQIVMGVLLTISGIASLFIIGIPFLIIFGLMYLIVPIIGVFKALNDEPWGYPIVRNFY